MSFAAPLFAWVAAFAALATVALHVLAWRRPPPSPLPTVRFVPERPVRMVSRAIRPADLALLALRVALVLLVGFALAGPVFARQPRGAARVVVLDRSRAAVQGTAVADSARAVFRPGDALVVFDSLAREVARATPDSVGAIPATRAPGSISAALVVAGRAARRLARERDSVQIVIVSPFATEAVDAATGPIRRAWPGPLRLVRAGDLPRDTISDAVVQVRSAAGDAVAAAYALAGRVPGGADVRVVRDSLTAADSALASEGALVVVWPRVPGDAWPRRSAEDTAFAVAAAGPSTVPMGAGGGGGVTVVAPFVRHALPPPGRAVARWSDGEPAATERSLGGGCVRAVAVAVPEAGDLALSASFRHFARRMAEPCGGLGALEPATDSLLAAILPATVGETASVSRAAAPVPAASATPRVTTWLLALALLAAVAELAVRRGVPVRSDERGGENAAA